MNSKQCVATRGKAGVSTTSRAGEANQTASWLPHRGGWAVPAGNRLLRLLMAGGAFATITPKAMAISDGNLDGEDHPYVGMVVAYADPAGTIPMWRGSGTLISPKIFVTAAHVVGLDAASGIAPARMQVYFQTDVAGTGYPFTGGHLGNPVPHPEWVGGFTPPNTHDIGVVVLDDEVVMPEYGQLPSLDVLESLTNGRDRQGVSFDIVGYGLQHIRQSPRGIIQLEADSRRYQGVVSLVNLENALVDGYNIMHSGDKGRGNGSGATSFGDSGGPVFLAGTNIMVGITSFGLNAQATGPGFAYRVDIEESQDFLGAVFALYFP